jgi:ankyrin repeat protein
VTAQRLGRLIAAGDGDAVEAAVGSSPRLLTATVERAGQGGWTPLHVAVAECQAGIVRLLLDAGADVDRRDPDTGRVPLHAAVTAGAGDSLEVVDALLAAGADVDATHRRRCERPGHQPGGGGPSPAGRRGPGDGERRPGRSPRVPRRQGLGPSHPVGGPDPA